MFFYTLPTQKNQDYFFLFRSSLCDLAALPLSRKEKRNTVVNSRLFSINHSGALEREARQLET